MRPRTSCDTASAPDSFSYRDQQRSKRTMMTVPKPITEETTTNQQQQRRQSRNNSLKQHDLDDPDAEKQNSSFSPSAIFKKSMKKVFAVFAPCFDADVISDSTSLLYVFGGECRSSSDNNNETRNEADDAAAIMELREKNNNKHASANGGHQNYYNYKYNNRRSRRSKQQLEIHTQDGRMLFDDDEVSKLSMHTLEEMEKLKIAQQNNTKNIFFL